MLIASAVSMRSKSNPRIAWLFCSLSVFLWTGGSQANPTPEEVCETIYTEAVKQAREALSQNKREDALRFLSDAAAVLERCLAAPEEKPQKETKKTTLALGRGLASIKDAV
jgi:hypothetical protein